MGSAEATRPFRRALTRALGGGILMDEKEIEREQVSWVFGLTGGELGSESLKFKGPGAVTGQELEYGWLYHYDGPPEWATSDFDTHDYFDAQYCTLVEFGCSYGSAAPELMIFPDGETWYRVAQFTHSGECECPEGLSGWNEKVGEGRTEGMERCLLCEADKGEEHGYIYLGDGCESVYRRIDFKCNECEVPQSEIRASGPGTICDCSE